MPQWGTGRNTAGFPPVEYSRVPPFCCHRHKSHPAKLHPDTEFLSAQLYAVSGTSLPNGLRLLQHLPCISSSSCAPRCHPIIVTLAALELHFAVSLLNLREAAMQCGPEGWVFALISLLTSCLCYLLLEGSLDCETEMGGERRM